MPLPPFPPLIVPLLDSVVIVSAFEMPAPPTPAMLVVPWLPPPLPPLILPRLVSVVIIPVFDTPAPPGRGCRRRQRRQ